MEITTMDKLPGSLYLAMVFADPIGGMMADGKKSLQGAVSEPARDPRVDRRDALRSLGRFAAVTPPTVGLLLSAASRPVHAGLTSECRTDLVCDDVPV